MNNLFKSKKFIKSLSCAILVTILMTISGCTTIEKTVKTVADVVLWIPRKITRGTSDLWREKISGSPEDWQQDLELGPRRKPIQNPGGVSYTNDLNFKYNTPSIQPRTAYPYPPTDNQTLDSIPFVPQSTVPQYYSPSQPQYAPQPEAYYPTTNQSQHIQDQQDLVDNFYPGDLPPQMQNNGYIPEPDKPWLNNNLDMKANQKPIDTIPPKYKKNGNYSSKQSIDNLDEEIDPYNNEGFKNDQFSPPSYQELQQNNFDPFIPPNNRLIRRFEPMTAEFYLDGTKVINDENQQPLDLQETLSKNLQDKTKRRKKSGSMFPLEAYAPKTNIMINNFSSEHQIQSLPSEFSDKEKVNEQIDAILKSLDKNNIITKVEEQTEENNSKSNIFKTTSSQDVPVTSPKSSDEIAIKKATNTSIKNRIKKVSLLNGNSRQEKIDKLVLNNKNSTSTENSNSLNQHIRKIANTKSNTINDNNIITRPTNQQKSSKHFPKIPEIAIINREAIIAKSTPNSESPPIVNVESEPKIRAKRNYRALPNSRYSNRRKHQLY